MPPIDQDFSPRKQSIKVKKALLITALLAAITAGCSKEYVYITPEDDSDKEQTDSADSGQNGDTIQDYITVEAALEKEYGETVCVGGYIVASCTVSIKNIDYTYPFKGSTAIILADDTVGTDSILPTAIMPVCLTDWTDLRKVINLEDNPTLHNKRAILTGTITKYMYRKGLKGVTTAMIDV